MIEGSGEGGASELVRLAARLIIEEALEGEARDIEALFADAEGKSLLSRTAISEITERLWAEYEAFAGRDLSEFEVLYLFVEMLPARLRQRCLAHKMRKLASGLASRARMANTGQHLSQPPHNRREARFTVA